MKALIHVGDRKAGSKSIQWFANRNEDLLQDNGILVSRATRCGPYHTMLTSYALDDSRIDHYSRHDWGITEEGQVAAHRAEVERRIADELSESGRTIHTVLFSQEALLPLNSDEIDRLTVMLRRHFSDFRIVAYIRRQDRHLAEHMVPAHPGR